MTIQENTARVHWETSKRDLSRSLVLQITGSVCKETLTVVLTGLEKTVRHDRCGKTSHGHRNYVRAPTGNSRLQICNIWISVGKAEADAGRSLWLWDQPERHSGLKNPKQQQLPLYVKKIKSSLNLRVRVTTQTTDRAHDVNTNENDPIWRRKRKKCFKDEECYILAGLQRTPSVTRAPEVEERKIKTE